MGASPPGPFLNKPLGYSLFPNELFPVPGSWAGTIANLVHYKRHDKGGHFAVSRARFDFLLISF
jgi:microsomal epoxide hydrolase